MKRKLSALTAAFAFLVFAFTASAEALSENNDWLYGTYSDGTAVISSGAPAVSKYDGNIVIPSEIDGYTVAEIGWYCFTEETGLFSVEIPETVGVVGNYAFENCYGLNTVNFDSNSQSAGTEIIGEGAFINCYGLYQLNLPAGLKTIGDKAFSSCSALSTVNVPYGVESIGAEAFAGCTALQSVILPVSVTELGDDIFDKCTSMLTIYYEGSSDDWEKIKKDEKDFKDIAVTFASYELPDDFTEEHGNVDGFSYRTMEDGTAEIMGYYGDEINIVVPSEINGYTVSKIGFACFAVDGEFTSVEIPSTVKVIEECFVYCRSLEKVILHEGLEVIGFRAFAGCEKLEEVTIPSTVTEIQKEAFEECTAIKEIIIPDSVRVIGERAFGDCENLEKVTFGKNITEMGEYCFVNCEALTTAEIPDGITIIEDSLFHNCSDLSEVIIPLSVSEIGSNAFFGCYDLERVFYGGDAQDWERIIIGMNNRRLTDSVKIYNYDPATYKPAGPGVAIILCAAAILVPVIVVIIFATRKRPVCPDCGAQLDDNPKFCGQCGREL